MNLFDPKVSPINRLPKIRSDAILTAIRGMPCALRISTFVPGHKCAPRDTVVGAHVGNIGKGTSTKVSDLAICAACLHCHDLYDRRDHRWEYLAEHFPAAVPERVLLGTLETQARLAAIGIIVVPGAEII